MADEIKLSVSLRVAKGGLSEAKNGSLSLTMTGTNYEAGTIDVVAGVHEVLPLTMLDLGVAWFMNLSTTNSIYVGTIEAPEYGGSFAPFLEIRPGGISCCELTSLDIAAQAVTGTAKLEYKVFER